MEESIIKFVIIYRVYGVSDLLGDIGGFKESIYVFGMLFIGFF